MQEIFSACVFHASTPPDTRLIRLANGHLAKSRCDHCLLSTVDEALHAHGKNRNKSILKMSEVALRIVPSQTSCWQPQQRQ